MKKAQAQLHNAAQMWGASAHTEVRCCRCCCPHCFCLSVRAAGTPLQPPSVSITAGAEGATLLVCPSLEAAAALAAGQQQQQQPTVSPAGALASAQPLQQGGAVGLKPSGLSRHSPGPLSRISPPISRGLGAGAAGAGGPGVGHRAAGAVASPYSRCTLAASAAAADLLMEPCPGVGPKAGVVSATTAAAAAAGSAGLGMPPAAAAAAAGGGDAKRGLSRVSPSLARRSQELQRSSDGGGKGKLPTLARTSSELPLAGAQCDNAVSLGVDMRAGPLSSLGTGQDVAAAAAAAHASGSLGEGVTATAGAGRAGRQRQQQQQLRRSKSQRPLKASAGAAVGERRVGGGGGGH
jgi:hypothetical protein